MPKLPKFVKLPTARFSFLILSIMAILAFMAILAIP
jgi:hypothetical protein